MTGDNEHKLSDYPIHLRRALQREARRRMKTLGVNYTTALRQCKQELDLTGRLVSTPIEDVLSIIEDDLEAARKLSDG